MKKETRKKLLKFRQEKKKHVKNYLNLDMKKETRKKLLKFRYEKINT